MSEGPSGVSAGYVDSAINSLRSEMRGEIRAIRSELHNEINRLEREMREVGEMIVRELRNQTNSLEHQIQSQTVAVVGGVAATTIMLERTKGQIEDDFLKTRTKLDLQTEATLQVEVGKKIADSGATHSKLLAFGRDIEERFNKSIEGFFLNRQLYNVNFKKIFDEYSNKIRTIGSHIFEIRDQDILPAINAAESSLEEIHNLPIEVDLMRLRIRSQNLDETLKILKESRFDQVLNSIKSLEDTLGQQFNIQTLNSNDHDLISIALVTSSPISTNYFIGQSALPIEKNIPINLVPNHNLTFIENNNLNKDIEKISSEKQRNLTSTEITKLIQASDRLVQKNFLSQEAAVLFQDFIASNNLKIVR
jgi:hypothetical protein